MGLLTQSLFQTGPDDKLIVTDAYSGGESQVPEATDPVLSNITNKEAAEQSKVKDDNELERISESDFSLSNLSANHNRDEEDEEVEATIYVLRDLDPNVDSQIEELSDEEKEAWYRRIKNSHRVEKARNRYSKFKDKNIGNPVVVTDDGKYHLDEEVWPEVSSSVKLMESTLNDSVICAALGKGLGALSRALRGIASGGNGLNLMGCVNKLIEVAEDPEASKRLANNIGHMYAEQGNIEAVNKIAEIQEDGDLSRRESKIANQMLSKYEPAYRKV